MKFFKNETKHKYLRELFADDNIPFPYGERDYHGFDARDTFNMDNTLVMWLYENLRYFQDEASKIIDFDNHEQVYDIDGKELTQRQCIDRMVLDCAIILDNSNDITESIEEEMHYFNEKDAAKDDLFKVLSKVYWAMWW